MDTTTVEYVDEAETNCTPEFAFVSPGMRRLGRLLGVFSVTVNLTLFTLMVYVVVRKTPRQMGAYKWWVFRASAGLALLLYVCIP